MSGPPLPVELPGEMQALLATLRTAEDRLHELTAGQVDALTDGDGRTFLLQRAQEGVRRVDAARRTAILNSLPANIALLDASGFIVAVNDAWRQFGRNNGLRGSSAAVGANYLDVCRDTHGDHSAGASWIADGLSSVLERAAPGFQAEYACHSPDVQRWFHMTATPMSEDRASGVVVMHVDITERHLDEVRIERLNRGYLVLSQISGLIVRVRDRDELFDGVCRIAVESGGFALAWIGRVDAASASIVPVASMGHCPDLPVGEGFSLGDERPCSLAVHSRQAVIVNDLANDSRFRQVHSVPATLSLVCLPIIVGGEVVAVFGLHAGDVDYFDDAEIALLTDLANDIGFAIDNLDKTAAINYLAYFDALTGLANRSLFLERAAQCVRVAAGAVLVLVDLERFKSINDSLGMHAGDDLLKQVATWLDEQLVDPTLLARVGSDHFALVLTDTDRPGDGARTLERLIKAFHEHPFLLGGSPFRIAAKFGIATFPDDATTAGGLFQKAESALKNAKARGNRHLFYTQKMTDSIARKLSQENQLRHALDNREFVLHYQPKINVQSRKAVSAEALIRWNDPRTQSLTPPAQFIPILEETGLILDVGRWAIERAIEDYLRWHRAGLPAVRIAVNVSPIQLRDPSFVEDVRRLLSVDPLAPAGLELEITESMIMTDIEQSIATLGALREMGLRIAIDDFGTGFSSLGYLSKLPVDTLKIDRSFVDDIGKSAQGLSLVSTMISLAHSFHLKVVAEGVETEEQSSLLKLLRCDEAQGYLYGRPVPADEFEARYFAIGATAR